MNDSTESVLTSKQSPLITSSASKKAKIDSDETKIKLKCDLCNYTTQKKYFLDKHYLNKHDPNRNNEQPVKPEKKLFDCEHCDKKFKDLISLCNHRNLHFGFKPHQCESCSDSFGTKGELTRHIKYKHTYEKPHKCNQCEYSTVELSKLRRHMRVHTDERPYLCHLCDYAARDTFKLKRHLRTHTGEKPYECPICKNCFSQSNSLKSHLKAYHKEVPNVLDETGSPIIPSNETDNNNNNNNNNDNKTKKRAYKLRQFKSNKRKLFNDEDLNNNTINMSDDLESNNQKKKEASLSSFIITNLDDKNLKTNEYEDDIWFTCDQCFMRFLTKDLLDEHVVKHTGERPFECEICGIKFSHKFALKAHLISHDVNYNEKIKPILINASQMTKNRFLHRKKKINENDKVSNDVDDVDNDNDDNSVIDQVEVGCTVINENNQLNTSYYQIDENKDEQEKDLIEHEVKKTLDNIIDKIKLDEIELIDLTNETSTITTTTTSTTTRLIMPKVVATTPTKQTLIKLIQTSPSSSLPIAGFIIPLNNSSNIKFQSSISTTPVKANLNELMQLEKTPETPKLETSTPNKQQQRSMTKKERLTETLNKSIEETIEKTIENLNKKIDENSSAKKEIVTFRAGSRKRLIQSVENSFVTQINKKDSSFVDSEDDLKSPKKKLNDNEKKFKCKYCDKCYELEFKLKRHVNLEHKSLTISQTEDFLSHLNATICGYETNELVKNDNETETNINGLKRYHSDSNLLVKSVYDEKNIYNDISQTSFKLLEKPKRNSNSNLTSLQKRKSHLALNEETLVNNEHEIVEVKSPNKKAAKSKVTSKQETVNSFKNSINESSYKLRRKK